MFQLKILQNYSLNSSIKISIDHLLFTVYKVVQVDEVYKSKSRFQWKNLCFGLYFVYKLTPFLLSNSRFKHYNIIL